MTWIRTIKFANMICIHLSRIPMTTSSSMPCTRISKIYNNVSNSNRPWARVRISLMRSGTTWRPISRSTISQSTWRKSRRSWMSKRTSFKSLIPRVFQVRLVPPLALNLSSINNSLTARPMRTTTKVKRNKGRCKRRLILVKRTSTLPSLASTRAVALTALSKERTASEISLRKLKIYSNRKRCCNSHLKNSAKR